MNPEVWGAPFWFIMHTIAINYPDRPTFVERRNHHDFFRNLASVIPCDDCRRNYSTHFAKYPIDSFLDSKYALLQWTIVMHNEVNKLCGKPDMTTTEVIKLYQQIYSVHDGYHRHFCCTGAPGGGGQSGGGRCAPSASAAAAARRRRVLTCVGAAVGMTAVAGLVGFTIYRARRSAPDGTS